MNLAERLASLEDRAEIADPVRTAARPKGWEPGVIWHGDKGEITTDALHEPPREWDDILRARGLDPEVFEVVNGKMRWCSWDGWRKGPDGESESAICYSFKAEIRKRTAESVDDLSLEELYKEVRKTKPKEKLPTGDSTFVVALSDWQTGNRDGGGIKAQAEAVANLIQSIPQRIATLRKAGHNIGHIVVLGMGDLVEGCFSADTEFVTRDGIRKLGEMVGQRVTVKTHYGKWVEADIKSFGYQPLWKIELSRKNARKTIFATAEHRWFRLLKSSANYGTEEVLTANLQVGDMFPSIFGRHPKGFDPEGVRHGFVYGDGHITHKHKVGTGCALNIHRSDWADILPYFDGYPTSKITSTNNKNEVKVTNESDYMVISGLAKRLKSVPPTNENVRYLMGWLMGYFAADGTTSGGSAVISSANRQSLEAFKELCSIVGIGTNPIRQQVRNTVFAEQSTIYSLSLIRQTIPPYFLIHSKHRKNWDDHQPSNYKNTAVWLSNSAKNWRVESIEQTDRVEEVFCAVVPEHHAFVLADDILTGNCSGHYAAQQFRVEIDRRDQVKFVRRGIRDIIMAVAPLAEKISVVAIPGNHGENRQNGKSITSVHDNDDVAVFEQVAEILAMNSDAYGHVGFRLSRDEIALGIEASEQIIAITHGHVSKPAGNSAQAMWNWWEKQTMGRAYPVVAAADILIAGHYHHLNVKEQENRSLFVCPSLTPVGEYWADANGVRTRCGTLSLVVTPAGWSDLTLL